MIYELRSVLYEFLKNLINMAYPYYVEAPADQTLPYIVFSGITGGVRWDTMEKDEEQYIQINGYGTLADVEYMKERIRQGLDNNPSALGQFTSGDDTFTVYDIAEQLNRITKLGDVWQFTLQFKIMIQKS